MAQKFNLAQAMKNMTVGEELVLHISKAKPSVASSTATKLYKDSLTMKWSVSAKEIGFTRIKRVM